jgi:hypothetical protein
MYENAVFVLSISYQWPYNSSLGAYPKMGSLKVGLLLILTTDVVWVFQEQWSFSAVAFAV